MRVPKAILSCNLDSNLLDIYQFVDFSVIFANFSFFIFDLCNVWIGGRIRSCGFILRIFIYADEELFYVRLGKG